MRIDNSSSKRININNDNYFRFPFKLEADLLIDESHIIWEEKKKSIHLKVKNTGLKKSGAFYIGVYTKKKNKPRKFLVQFYISQVDAGKSIQESVDVMKFAHHYENNLNDIDELVIQLDYNNRVKESNEKNNIKVVKVSSQKAEPVKLSTLYPRRKNPLKVNFYIERLKVLETEDSAGEDEPFLWVYGIHIDCKTLKNDEYVVRIPYPGHNNLNTGLNDKESTYIPADVGHISLPVNELPVIGALSGVLVIAMDEDAGPSNRLIKLGYEAGAKAINDVIKELKEIQTLKDYLKDVSYSYNKGIDVNVIISKISSRIKTAVKDEMKRKGSGWYDFWASSFKVRGHKITMDPDDTIGQFMEFVFFNDLTKKSPLKTHKYSIKGKGARYEITRSISTETFPTIDKTVKEYHWTRGWAIAEFFTLKDTNYLFLLKPNDGTVHIHKMENDGLVGEKVVEYDWTSGWTTAKFFEVNNKTYLFLLKSENGKVNIHKIKNDGSVGALLAKDKWSNGWTTAKFVTLNHKTYLFLLKSGNGKVNIHEMNSTGSVGKKIEKHEWTSGWTTAEFFVVNNKTYLFLLKLINGTVNIHEMNTNGTVGKKVFSKSWSSGWNTAKFFISADNKTYLWLSKGSGKVHMHEMNNDGTVGRYIDIRQWGMYLTNVSFYKVGFKNFLLSITAPPFSSKSLVLINSLKFNNLLSYNSVKSTLQYGDIVLFSGDGLGSGIIQASSISKWSHIGIVYQEASNKKDVMLLEAIPKRGVRLVKLGEKIKGYKGQVSIRTLNVKRNATMRNQLDRLYRELKGRPYESLENIEQAQEVYNQIKKDGLEELLKGKSYREIINILLDIKNNELAKSVFDLYDSKPFKLLGQKLSTLNSKNLNSLFCSELVAEAYQRMGLLPQHDRLHPSNEYIPHDFSACESLTLLKGELDEEIAIL